MAAGEAEPKTELEQFFARLKLMTWMATTPPLSEFIANCNTKATPYFPSSRAAVIRITDTPIESVWSTFGEIAAPNL